MSWTLDYGNGRTIEYPDGHDAESLGELAYRAQQNFVAMQVSVWGNWVGAVVCPLPIRLKSLG